MFLPVPRFGNFILRKHPEFNYLTRGLWVCIVLLMDQNQSTFNDLAKRHMVATLITSWQIPHINCLETLSDWIDEQI